jgi:hypothetical protein
LENKYCPFVRLVTYCKTLTLDWIIVRPNRLRATRTTSIGMNYCEDVLKIRRCTNSQCVAILFFEFCLFTVFDWIVNDTEILDPGQWSTDRNRFENPCVSPFRNRCFLNHWWFSHLLPEGINAG